MHIMRQAPFLIVNILIGVVAVGTFGLEINLAPYVRLQDHHQPSDLRSTQSMTDIRGGKERWDVKTGKDSEAPGIDLNNPIHTTVKLLVQKSRPVSKLGVVDHQLPMSSQYQKKRASSVEKHAFVVDAEIIDYKIEYDTSAAKHGDNPGDSDCHIVIRQPGSTETMVVEIPHPSANMGSSPWKQLVTDARSQFESDFHPHLGSFPTHPTVKSVRLVGIGFFDYVHQKSGPGRATVPRGMSESNALELHPILYIGPSGQKVPTL